MSEGEIAIVCALFLLWLIPGETAEGLFWIGIVSSGAWVFAISPILSLF